MVESSATRRPWLGGPGEVAQEEATGAVATAYEEIRSVLGAPFVPTVYRMLAVHPDVLVPAVDGFRPMLQQGPAQSFLLRAREVVRAALPTAHIESRPTGGDQWVGQLLERYLRVNPPGLLFVLALLGRDVRQRPRVMSPPLPPAAPDVWSDIRAAHGGVTIPGFWREMADAPDLLESLWAATRRPAERGGLDRAREAVLQLGADALTAIGVRSVLDAVDPGEAARVRDRLSWFPHGISAMMAETEWLHLATAPGRAGSDDTAPGRRRGGAPGRRRPPSARRDRRG